MRKNEIDKTFERITKEIRNEQPDRATVEAAADRVWRTVAAPEQQMEKIEKIRSCADFQALVPSYLHGGLSDGRRLLFEDHTRECIPCRRALKEAKTGQLAQVKQSHTSYGIFKVAVAAMIFVTFAYALMPFVKHFFNYVPTVSARVELADGHVYTVADNRLRSLTTGAPVAPDEIVRTGKDSAAILKLNDGSSVEMNERSEFTIADDGNGRTIRLKRGSIIVQAVEQKSGRLYVSTEDCLISVKGTTFSVTSGTKGSRVSVLAGEVVFDHAGQERTLRPGEQAVTGSSLDQVPLKDEVYWSRNRDRYIQIISELESLRNEIAKVPTPALRTASSIIDLLPEQTVCYVALPNLSENLSESYRLFEQRVSESPTLQEWFGKNRRSDMNELMQMVQQIGSYIGDELVISGFLDATARLNNFVGIAEVRDRSGLANLLSTKNVSTVSDPATAASGPGIWLSDRFIVVTSNGEALKTVAARMQQPADSGFARTPFYARIKEVYSDGAGLIIAADIETMLAANAKEKLASLGLSNVRHFIAEQKQVDGRTRNRAVLTFRDKRTGVASWLATPAPMGALEYISPEANLAAGFVVKDPSFLFDDLMGFLSKESDLKKTLADLESHGISLKHDFAEVIGGEFAFALDGPILPTPSWKMVLEVYDATRLQNSIEATVAAANREAPEARLAFSKSELNGLTIYTIKPEKGGVSINYTFTNGYMIVAASTGLVERAVKYRQSGYTLLRSPKFTAALPEDGSANFSAVLYHNLAALLAPVAEEMAETAEGRASANALVNAAPTLVAAYAHKDRIVVAANTEGGLLGLNPAMLFGMPSSVSIQKMIYGAMRQKK